MQNEKCFVRDCKNLAKFTIAAELVGYKSDVKMCQIHLLMNLRGASQAIADSISEALQVIVKEQQ